VGGGVSVRAVPQTQIATRKVGGIEVGLIAEGMRRIFLFQIQILPKNPSRFVNAGDGVRKCGLKVRCTVGFTADVSARAFGPPQRAGYQTPLRIKQYIPDGTVGTEVNMYVVKTKEGTVVIDAGFGAGILEGLQKPAIDPAGASAVAPTHTHGDRTRGLLKSGVSQCAALFAGKRTGFLEHGRRRELCQGIRSNGV
jgi:hypothetical protein